MDYAILGVSPNASFDEIKQAWRQLCKTYHPDNKETGDANKFREINEAFKRLTDNINSHTISRDSDAVDYKGIIDDYIKYAFTKYKDANQVIGYLNTYLSGNVNGITRDHNYRQLFQDFLSMDIVREVVCGSIEQYVNDIVKSYDPPFDAFLSACKATYLKYGKAQLVSAINEAIKGDYSRFTNDGKDLRERFKSLTTKEDIYQYIDNITCGKALDPNVSIGEQTVDDIIAYAIKKSGSRAV